MVLLAHICHLLCEVTPRVFKSLFILWITGPCSSVRPSLTRAWWLSATGYVADFEPPPGRGGRQWLGSLPRLRRGWHPTQLLTGHPVDSHFGLLFPISFIPWLCNGPKGPKKPYPTQTKPNAHVFRLQGTPSISQLCLEWISFFIYSDVRALLVFIRRHEVWLLLNMYWCMRCERLVAVSLV